MERYNRIADHPIYKEALSRTQECEADRIYCLHGFAHALDVARIAYILALESGSKISKDIIYAAAFLHDIGRFAQAETGKSHDEAGARLAAAILPDCGYAADEADDIVRAIRTHRSAPKGISELSDLLCRADKLSRDCPRCASRSTCYWSDEEKNSRIII